MTDSNNQTPQEAGPLAALEQRLLGHEAFGQSGTIGARVQKFADLRTERHRQMWRPGTGSYALGAREMAVEVGLRYLPLAADPEFLPVHGYEDRELYPASWQNWLNADLLRLFEDEEEELLAQAWIGATATRAMQRRATLRAAAPAAEARQPARRKPSAPLAVHRQLAKIAALTERVERLAGDLARPLQAATRARMLRLAPADVAEMVTVSADALGEAPAPAIAERLAATTTPEVREQLARSGAALPLAPLIDTVTQVAARQARSPYPANLGRAATFSRLIASKPTVSTPLSEALTRRPVKQLLESTTDRVLRLPVAAPTRTLVAAVADDEVGTEAVRQAVAWTADVEALAQVDRPGLAAFASKREAPPIAAWLDDVGVDAETLPALTGSLTRVMAQSQRTARGAALVMAPDSPRMQFLDRVEERVSGARTGAPVLADEQPAWRRAVERPTRSRLASHALGLDSLVQVLREADVPAEAGQEPGGIAPPITPTERRLAAPTVPPLAAPSVAPALARLTADKVRRVQAAARTDALVDALTQGRESVRLAGLTSYDPDPAAPASDTRIALRAAPESPAVRRAAQLRPEAGHYSLVDLAPRVLDTAFTTPAVARPDAGPAPVTVGAAPSLAGAPAERTWQLFSPPKALSLSMLLAGSDDPAVAGSPERASVGREAARMAVVLTEGRRALADWHVDPSIDAIQRRALTPFGTVALEPRSGSVRAMRIDPVLRGPVVQLLAESGSRLDSLARRAQVEVAGAAAPIDVARPQLARPVERALGARTIAAAAAPTRLAKAREQAVSSPLVSRAVARIDATRHEAAVAPSTIATSPAPLAMTPALRQAMVLTRLTAAQAATPAAEPVTRLGSSAPRVVASQEPARLSLPAALRAPMRLLTALPEGARRSLAPDAAVMLPTQVALPGRLTRALRTPMAGVTRPTGLQVLAVLDSAQALVSEARPRERRAAPTADRVFLMSVEQRDAAGTPAVEYARPVAPSLAPAAVSAVQRRAMATPSIPTLAAALPTPATAPQRAALVQAGVEAPTAPAVAAPTLAAASYASITQQQRALGAASPAVVREMVAAGKLAPEVLDWAERVAPLASATSAPALGAFAPDFSLGGVRSWTLPSVALPTLLTARESVTGVPPSPIPSLADRPLGTVEARPSLLSRRAEQPLYVTISDEVAHAAPLATEVARRSLLPLTQVEARSEPPTSGEPVARAWSLGASTVAYAAEPSPREERARQRRSWATGVVARTEGFAEGALERLEGRARPVRGLASPGAPTLVSIVADEASAARRPIGAAVEAPRSLMSLPKAQAEQILARLGGVRGSAEQSIRTMRLARGAAEGALVSIAQERPSFEGITEPTALASAARSLGLPSAMAAVTAQPSAVTPAPQVTPSAPSPTPSAVRAAMPRSTPALVAPEAAPPTTVRVESAAPSAAPRRIQPQLTQRVEQGAQRVTRRAFATIQREAESELRRHGMTQGRIQSLTSWTPRTAAAIGDLGAPTRETRPMRGVSSGWAAALLAMPSLAEMAPMAAEAGPGLARGERVRRALSRIIGETTPAQPIGLSVGAEAGLPSFAAAPAVAGPARRRSQLAGVDRGALVAPAATPSATTQVAARRAASASAAPTARATAPTGAAQQYQPWSTLRDLAGLAFSAIADDSRPTREPERIRATPNLRWVENELSTLIQAGSGVRARRTTREPIRPRAAEATRTMLAYLDAQEEPQKRPVIPGLGVPGGAPGALVSPPPRPVPPGRTRLAPKPVERRPVTFAETIQGDAMAGARELVSPSIGAPRQPDISIQPLAAKGGQSGGQDAERSETAKDGASPPQDKLEEMAAEIMAIISDREELEADRLGGM